MSKSFINFDLVNYDKAITFTLNSENRTINRGHLNNMKKEWLTSAALMPPITVNVATNHITDGQHRWSSYIDLVRDNKLSRETRLKVMYVNIDPKDEKDVIIASNTHSKNWVADDYVNSYAHTIDDYKTLAEWCKSHELTNCKGKAKYIYGAAIITGKQCRQELMKGDFRISENALEQAETIHAEMVELKNAMNIQGSNSWITTLAMSWHNFRNMHNFKDFLSETKSKMRASGFQRLPKQAKSDFDYIFAQIHTSLDMKGL